jgi:anaerobic selenocysteine-containing dehydrogenase
MFGTHDLVSECWQAIAELVRSGKAGSLFERHFRDRALRKRDVTAEGTSKCPIGNLFASITARQAGRGALKALSEHLLEQRLPVKGATTLRCMNQPEGFDCPGCAWHDPKHTSSFEFCENGAKAVAWEATAKRCTPEFFVQHSVAELSGWSDYEREMVGRLTHPITYDANSDHYVPVSWEQAFATIGGHLRALPDPNMAEFYTSGRTSNEAAFLYQLFVRESMSDRYRGVYGQRDVVFLNKSEMEKRNLTDGDRVDLVTVSTDGIERRAADFCVVGYSFPDGCCAAYYPETNPLVPLYAHDPISFTRSSKGVPVRIERSRAVPGADLSTNPQD